MEQLGYILMGATAYTMWFFVWVYLSVEKGFSAWVTMALALAPLFLIGLLLVLI